MHENEKPVFFKRDLFFTKLVVDKIKVDIGGAVLAYTVYYAGTSKSVNMLPLAASVHAHIVLFHFCYHLHFIHTKV